MAATPITPSALIRFWLQREHRRHRLDVPGFAKDIGVTPAAVHNWISGERGTKRGISERYWDAMARFYDFQTPEEFVAAARVLYFSEERRVAS